MRTMRTVFLDAFSRAFLLAIVARVAALYDCVGTPAYSQIRPQIRTLPRRRVVGQFDPLTRPLSVKGGTGLQASIKALVR
jgi:hypothetical protein